MIKYCQRQTIPSERLECEIMASISISDGTLSFVDSATDNKSVNHNSNFISSQTYTLANLQLNTFKQHKKTKHVVETMQKKIVHFSVIQD